MTRVWRINASEAIEAVRSFLNALDIKYVGLDREWILKSFELAQKLNHDVYDCSYLALAMMVKTEAIVTTDTDFESLAPRVGLRYIDPVPKEIPKKFCEYPYKARETC